DPAAVDAHHRDLRDERALPRLRHSCRLVGSRRRDGVFGRRPRGVLPLQALALNRFRGGVSSSTVTKQLWAPWRLEYIKQADEQEGCVFCLAAAASDEQGLVVHRGERAFVLLNKFPYSSGHLMVAPFRHVGEFGELEDDEAVEIHRLAA